jgi:hypothetical protein
MRYFKNIKNLYPRFDKFGNFFILTKKIHRDLLNDNFDVEFELSYSGLVENTTYDENNEYIDLVTKDSNFTISNSLQTLKSYKQYLDSFYGDVLISGLGLGVLILPLLDDVTITKIDIVESDASIINYVYTNRLKNLDGFNKINIINGDIFTININNNYDYILLNNWVKYDNNTLSEVETLKTKYTPNLKENGKIDAPILGFY